VNLSKNLHQTNQGTQKTLSSQFNTTRFATSLARLNKRNNKHLNPVKNRAFSLK